MSTNIDTVAAPSDLPSGKRVLSGTQPTGYLHLGNYFGAIRQYIAFQEANDCAYFIADYHSMTAIRDAEQRRSLVRHVAMAYLALGVDPKRSILYRQSDLPEVHELTWMLTTLTPMGLLERAHSYKDKIAQGVKAEHGLFAYPVLMAADILIHSADFVPVGQDQKQHLEMARDIAVKFNLAYEEVFTLPEPYILKDVAVVPGVDGQKMSKSYDNTVQIFEATKALKKQIMRIQTDSTPVEDPKDPDLPVFQLFNLFANADEREKMAARARQGGLGYGDVKKSIFEKLQEYFEPAIERYRDLEAHPDTLEDILRDGAARARESVAPLMARVRSAAGIGGEPSG